MSVTDIVLENNHTYAAHFLGPLPLPPTKQLAVIACMDARLDVYRLLGLAEGEAHVIRNAGGVVTDDAVRSLAISQRMWGTKEIVLIHHTDCGMLTLTEDVDKVELAAAPRHEPERPAEAFEDLVDDLRRSIDRITASPLVLEKGSVRGFVFDVATGELTEVVG